MKIVIVLQFSIYAVLGIDQAQPGTCADDGINSIPVDTRAVVGSQHFMDYLQVPRTASTLIAGIMSQKSKGLTRKNLFKDGFFQRDGKVLDGCNETAWRIFGRISEISSCRYGGHHDFARANSLLLRKCAGMGFDVNPNSVITPESLHVHRMAVLRDPVEWAQSFFTARKNSEGSWEKSVTAFREHAVYLQNTGRSITGVGFLQWLRDAHWSWGTNVRGITGDFRPHHQMWLGPGGRKDRLSRAEAATRLLLHDPDTQGETRGAILLAEAKRRVDALAFVGTFGYFRHPLQETVELLAHTFCWNMDDLPFRQHLPEQIRRRTSKRDSAPAQKVRRALDAFVASMGASLPKFSSGDNMTAVQALGIDALLYAHAQRLFETRLATMYSDRAQGIVCRPLMNPNCVVTAAPAHVA